MRPLENLGARSGCPPPHWQTIPPPKHSQGFSRLCQVHRAVAEGGEARSVLLTQTHQTNKQQQRRMGGIPQRVPEEKNRLRIRIVPFGWGISKCIYIKF